MSVIREIGIDNPAIEYIDRPTVKVIIRYGTGILIVNEGLLPGGGIENGENDAHAIERELSEELGVTVKNIKFLGTIIQFRDFLKKRYVIRGFTADFVGFDKDATPQDYGEASFTYEWLQKEFALKHIDDSINTYTGLEVSDDSHQGRLFNLMTSRELLLALK